MALIRLRARTLRAQGAQGAQGARGWGMGGFMIKPSTRKTELSAAFFYSFYFLFSFEFY